MITDILAHIIWVVGTIAVLYFEIDLYLYQSKKRRQ